MQWSYNCDNKIVLAENQYGKEDKSKKNGRHMAKS